MYDLYDLYDLYLNDLNDLYDLYDLYDLDCDLSHVCKDFWPSVKSVHARYDGAFSRTGGAFKPFSIDRCKN